MRLEDLTVALRPRQPWEAADLGCALVRRDYGRVLLLWLISTVPLWGLLAVLLRNHPLAFWVVAWWLKPLYDRLPLHYLSRAAFGAKPPLKESLREWPRLWSRFLLSALVFRRFSFIRSFALPVWMLEGQRGKAVKKRLRSLAVDGGSSGTSVTFVFLQLEFAVFLGITALASSLGPTASAPDMTELFLNPGSFLDTAHAQFWFSNVLYLCAMTVVEPFYVGAGFGLYLNSRTKIEGWDIELVFRRLAARLRTAAVAALTLLLLLPGGLQAQDASSAGAAPEVETALQDILAKPEFKEHTRTQKMWFPDVESPDVKVGSPGGDPRWLGWLFYGIVSAVVAVFVVWGIRWLILNKHLFKGGLGAKKKVREAGPRVIMGLDIASESLPEDIVQGARQAWSANHPREALSLLYRGALSRLVEQRRLPIRDSDTEDDCLLQVAGLGDEAVTAFFRQLTLVWVRAAYAGEEAREDEFETLCRTWPFAPMKAGAKPRQPVLASVAAALLLLPLLTGCKGHWEDITLPLGYQGKARTNPFLAAQQLLEVYGHEAERLPTLKELPKAWKGVIIVSGESGMPEARARQLLDWVDEGGHLIYAVAGCAPYNDWGMFSGLASYVHSGNEDRADPVLEALGVKVASSGELEALFQAFQDELKNVKPPSSKEESKDGKDAPEKDREAELEAFKKKLHEPADVPTLRSQMKLGEEDYAVDFVDVLKLSLNRPTDEGESVAGTPSEATALSLIRGEGRVTVLNHARPLRNRYLDENDHARWLMALVGDEPRTVQFIVTLQSSFWALLWNRAWMPLVGLALLALVWLWLHMPRFGPLRRVVLHDTKHFAEHIGALGQFFYRLKRPDILLGAAADAVRARALRLHPHLGNLDDEALVELLTQTSTLSKERIREAMTVSGKVPGHEMVRRLQDLQTLKTALG